MSNTEAYRKDLDLLKGIAITAVILYHLGLLQSGYLGVDLFFVINGFLVVPGICRKVQNREFGYIRFLIQRLMRLTPLLLLACMVSLLVGFYGMLPDDYENLGQAVVASLAYSNNLLQSITTKDYWNVVNEYKPLMQTWYLGILMEFYVVFPIVPWVAWKLTQRWPDKTRKCMITLLAVATILSLTLYLLPVAAEGIKFYWLPFRFWELGLGGLAGLLYDQCKDWKIRQNKVLYGIAGILLIGVLLTGSGSLGLILTVLVATVMMGFHIRGALEREVIFSYLGKRSYSLFLWHQVVVAFYRYYCSSQITVLFLIGYVAVILGLSHVTYRYVENRIEDTVRNRLIVLAVAAVTGAVSLLLYLHAGVVRDIPELDVVQNDVHRNMHAEYVDRIYAYDKEFPEENGKWNVMLVGNSFARDFGNILLESELADQINISYAFDFSKDLRSRLSQCDMLFCFSSKAAVPDVVWELVEMENVWGIGTKSYGENNGQIYRRRFAEDYFTQTVIPNAEFESQNEQLRKEWGNNYIDLMEYARMEDGSIRVFSDENKFISQDCIHLTQGGASYYAKVINWREIFPSGNR